MTVRSLSLTVHDKAPFSDSKREEGSPAPFLSALCTSSHFMLLSGREKAMKALEASRQAEDRGSLSQTKRRGRSPENHRKRTRAGS